MKRFNFLLLIFLLFSCQNSKNNSANQSEANSYLKESSSNSKEIDSSSYDTTSSEEKSFESSTLTSEKESSSSTSSSTSKEELNKISLIKEVKELKLQELVNDIDVATSLEEVTIKATLLNRMDVITTKKGYGDRYKLFVMDESGYLYIQVNYQVYQKTENLIGKNFEFEGNIALYCHEPEIVLNSYKEINDVINIDFDALSINYETIKDIHNDIKNLSTNCKGIANSYLINIKAKYIGIHDDKVLLFSDGSNLILVHTLDKVKNSLSINSSYKLYATLNMYYYRPGLTFIKADRIDDIDISNLKSNSVSINAETLYKTPLYDKDNDKSNMFYPSYSDLYQYLYHFEGYVDYYLKNGKYYYVLLDSLIDHKYEWTEQNARDNKALFLVNNEYYNLNENEFIKANLYESYMNSIKVDIYFSLDLYNSSNYYQVFCVE